MNKKFIPLIIVIAVILLGVGVYLFLSLNPTRQEQLQNTVQNLFPFGQPVPAEQPNNNGVINPDATGNEDPSVQNVPALRKVSDLPTTDYVSYVTEELQMVPRTITNANGESEVIQELRPVTVYGVRYDNKNNGSINNSIIGPTITNEQLTDTSIPNSERLVFGKNGNNFIFQYATGFLGMETIKTYQAAVQKIPLYVDACPFAFPTNLKFQDQSDAVANVQRFLNGYLGIVISQTGENSPGNETGIFDELTRQAVITFQTMRGLTNDGSVGPKTRETFLVACNEIQTKKAEEQYRQSNTFAYKAVGSFMADGIAAIEPVDTDTFFYLLNNANGGTTGLFFNATTKAAQQVFDSPFNEWLVYPQNKDHVFFTTKAASSVPGYLYDFDVRNKKFTKVLGNINGLTTLVSPDAKRVLYSASVEGGVDVYLFNRETGTTTNIGIDTLPEKCTWDAGSIMIYCAVPESMPVAVYPDNWYQGLITTDDQLWSINGVTGTTQRIYDPQEVTSAMNISNLSVSSDGRYLFFRNTLDSILWVLDLFQ